jgi:nucleoside-diphosphate-sugar epimerase
MRVLVTGATGFVGHALVQRLVTDEGASVVAATRRPRADLPPDVVTCSVGDISADTRWGAALEGVDVVIHAAARVHVMRENASDPLAEFRAVNVAGTLALARQAAAAGVRRFVLVSSVKVNGEETAPGRPFTERDVPAPADPYGVSKLEAEQVLAEVAADTGLEGVIVRPALVYGPGVGANFRSMMRILQKGLPLPLGGIHNRRSLVALDNLTHFLVRTASHPAAAGQTFLVSDGDDLSTPELLRRTAKALGVPARLVSVPPALLEMTARVLGRGAEARRLCRSLQVDIAKAHAELGWSPPVSVDEALERTASAFLGHLRR